MSDVALEHGLRERTTRVGVAIADERTLLLDEIADRLSDIRSVWLVAYELELIEAGVKIAKEHGLVHEPGEGLIEGMSYDNIEFGVLTGVGYRAAREFHRPLLPVVDDKVLHILEDRVLGSALEDARDHEPEVSAAQPVCRAVSYGSPLQVLFEVPAVAWSLAGGAFAVGMHRLVRGPARLMEAAAAYQLHKANFFENRIRADAAKDAWFRSRRDQYSAEDAADTARLEVITNPDPDQFPERSRRAQR